MSTSLYRTSSLLIIRVNKETVPLLRPEDFFDLDGFEFDELFDGCEYVWEAISGIGKFALTYIATIDDNAIAGRVMTGAHVADTQTVIIGEGTVVEPGAYIEGPTIIGYDCQIRHGAYIRGNVVIGNNSIVGHSTEIKNSIMLNHSQAPHFAYIGDSILGNGAGLGAGTKLANLPMNGMKDPAGKRRTIVLYIDGKEYDTGLVKFGAIVGDEAQTGCNVVTSPGCLIGKRTLIYPSVALDGGYYGSDQVIRLSQKVESVARKELSSAL
jgi:UDP-N-acetylglucosamine diphosphorylase / glucose-1-phosphate thymidylyltransferase / UDP-N-acetylgalactosamine diphosphorylase / glucosamine-1-phosphate N-acetyltransferase / galactosamine-1-phosphate N-acetyltransferase